MLATVGRKPLLFLLLGAFVLRAATGIALQDHLDRVWKRSFLIEGDAAGYWELGRKIAQRQPYALYEPPRKIYRMPGFPAFLALSIRMSGGSFLWTRILLAGVGAAACGLVFCLGRELFDKQTGLIAACFTAISPVMTGFSVVILSETLFAACLLASLLVLAKLINTKFQPDQRNRAILLSLGAGVTIAAACYVRPSWLAVGPIFAVLYPLMADNRKQAALRSLLVLAGLGLALFPWAYRNQRISGHWIATTLWVGPSLYDGLSPRATGDSDMSFFENDRALERMTEFEVDRFYRRKAWQFAAENPGRTLQLALLKLVRFWKPWPNAAQFHGWLNRTAVLVFFIPVMLLAVRGCWICRRQFWPVCLTLGPVLYFAAIHTLFVASLRYRLPAEYPLCVLSAVGLQSWLNKQPETSV